MSITLSDGRTIRESRKAAEAYYEGMVAIFEGRGQLISRHPKNAMFPSLEEYGFTTPEYGNGYALQIGLLDNSSSKNHFIETVFLASSSWLYLLGKGKRSYRGNIYCQSVMLTSDTTKYHHPYRYMPTGMLALVAKQIQTTLRIKEGQSMDAYGDAVERYVHTLPAVYWYDL